MAKQRKSKLTLFLVNCLKHKIVKTALLAALCAALFYLIYEYFLPQQPVPLLKAEENLVVKIRAKPNDVTSTQQNSSIYQKIISDNSDADEQVKLHQAPEDPMTINKYPSYDIMDYLSGDKTEEKQPNIEIKEKKLNIIFVDKNGAEKKYQQDTYYSLELSSVRTEEEALSELAKLQKVHYKLIGNMPYIIEYVNMEKHGGFYKLLIGNMTSFSEAKNLCRKISSLNHRCLVVKNKAK